MIRISTILLLLLAIAATLSSCSNDDPSPKGPKFYLKEEYRNGTITSSYIFNSKNRKILSDSNYFSGYTKYEYPSNTEIIATNFDHNETGTKTTYKLNSKGHAISSNVEYIGFANKVNVKNIYEYDAEDFLIKTTSTRTDYSGDPNSGFTTITSNKIENGNIVETKVVEGSRVLLTTYTYSDKTQGLYVEKNDLFGKKNTNLIETTTVSGNIAALGEVFVYSTYTDYVLDKNNLVESYKENTEATFEQIEQQAYTTTYKKVYDEF